MVRIMISKSVIKYEHDGVEEDDDKNGEIESHDTSFTWLFALKTLMPVSE